MTTPPPDEAGAPAPSGQRTIGERLRRIRRQHGLSLQQVERVSDGYWKAAVIGSYERGDRNITASRLLELAAFYGVPATELLPVDAPPTQPPSGGVVLDLTRIGQLEEEWGPFRRYCAAIQHQRGDYAGRVLSIRAEDLRALAVMMDRDIEALVAELRERGVIIEPENG